MVFCTVFGTIKFLSVEVVTEERGDAFAERPVVATPTALLDYRSMTSNTLSVEKRIDHQPPVCGGHD
jgi:hypothetical protein